MPIVWGGGEAEAAQSVEREAGGAGAPASSNYPGRVPGKLTARTPALGQHRRGAPGTAGPGSRDAWPGRAATKGRTRRVAAPEPGSPGRLPSASPPPRAAAARMPHGAARPAREPLRRSPPPIGGGYAASPPPPCPRPLRRRFPAPPPPPPGAASVAATVAAAGPGPGSARRAGVESQPEPLPAAPP